MKKRKELAVKARLILEKFIYLKIIMPVLSISRIGRNTIKGDADSGISIDYLYRNKPKGLYSIGKFVDGVVLRLPAVKATQRKKDIIIKVIQNEVSNNLLLEKKTKILDLASGPARYLVEFLDKGTSLKNEIEILCVDNDKQSVNYGNIIGKSKPIRFIKGNTFKMGTLKRFSKKIGWKPNIILCTGFFELNDDKNVRSLLNEIYGFIEKNGLLMFTSQADNPSKKLMKTVGKTRDGSSWKMHFRDPHVLRKWMLEIGFRDVIISLDSWGMYEYCTGRKL